VNLSDNEFDLLSVGRFGLDCNNNLSVKHSATGVSGSHSVNQENFSFFRTRVHDQTSAVICYIFALHLE
jgi:hypothetical protein